MIHHHNIENEGFLYPEMLSCCHVAINDKTKTKNFNTNHLFCREIQEKDAEVKGNAKYANNSKVDSARPENLDKSEIETKIYETH